MEFLGSPVKNSEEDDAKEDNEKEETPPPWNDLNMQDFEVIL